MILPSTSSSRYIESAEKMLQHAKENYEEGLHTAEISYLMSAKQDIENSLYAAELEDKYRKSKLSGS